MSANVGYVGHNADHLVTPVEGNQPLPGVGDPSTWAPLKTRRPLYATAPLITNISTTASRGHSDYNALQVSVRQRNVKGLEYLASYTLERVRTNNLGYYGSGRRGRRRCVLDEHVRAGVELRAGLLRRAAQLRVLGQLRDSVRPGPHVWQRTSRPLVDAILGGWRLSGIFQARTGLPDHGDRRQRTVAAGRPRQRAAELHRRSGAVGPEHHPLAGHQRLPARPRGTWGNCGIGVARAPGYKNIDAVLAKRFSVGGDRAFEFRAEAFNLTNTPELRSARARHQRAEHVRQITSTVSTARTVELVLKFFF